MPLVGPDLPLSTLRELWTEQRDGAREVLAMVEAPPAPVREPLGLVTARDLLLAALAAGALRADATADEVATATNLLYESSLAAIDLVKMHTEMPKVPRGKARAPAPSG